MGHQLYHSASVPPPPSSATADTWQSWANKVTELLNSQTQFVYDVRDYGGSPNNPDDSSTPIRKAIEDAGKQGGGTVYLSHGTWRITSGLSLNQEGIRLQGAGRGVTRASWATFGPTVLLCDFSDSSDPAVHITDRNCAVRDMEIYAAPGSSTSDAVFIDAANHSSTLGLNRIERVNISDFDNHGIRVEDGELTLIDHTYVEHCGGSGITIGKVNHGGMGNTIRRSRVRYNGGAEQICLNIQHATLLDCVEVLRSNQTGDSYGIYANGCTGTTILNPDIEWHSSTTGIHMTRSGKCQIIGGYFGELQCGIETDGDAANELRYLTVIGGQFASACSLGIYVGQNTDSLILINPDFSLTTTAVLSEFTRAITYISDTSLGLGVVPSDVFHIRAIAPSAHLVADGGQNVTFDLGEASGSVDTTAHGMQFFVDGNANRAHIRAKRSNSYETALSFPYNNADFLGYVGVAGINFPKAPLHVSGNTFIPFTGTHTPAAGDSVGTTGMICYDTNYLYLCTSADSWSRITLTTF